ncbi:Alcohol acetyltransferase [Microdochium nivale]|nr:Alcohol acetyltransferase [Microdochium nivale]
MTATTTHSLPSTMRVVRKFGINETYQLAMYLLDQYRGTCLSCRYAIPPRLRSEAARPELEKIFKAAVVDIIARHPMLQVGMADCASKTPSWVQLPRLDLAQHIRWHHLGAADNDFAQTVQQIFRTQLDDKFPDPAVDARPNWTMTVVHSSDGAEMEVLLTWNHPQFDGAGARVIHEDLVTALNIITTTPHNDDHGDNLDNTSHAMPGLDGDILTLPDHPSPILPIPIEKLAKLPVDLTFLARTLWSELRPASLNRDPSLARWCPIKSNSASVPYKTQFRSFDISPSALASILARCRHHETTLTGLLNALALLSFSRHLDAKTAPAFQSSTVMDHRRNLPPPPSGEKTHAPQPPPWGWPDRAVANYVTQLPHRYDAVLVARIRSRIKRWQQIKKTAGRVAGEDGQDSPLSTELLTELWLAAAQSRREIKRQLELGLRNDTVGVFGYVRDWQATMRDMARRPRQFTWLVTNIGVLDGGGRGGAGDGDGDRPWAITRAQFGLSAETPAAAIEFSPVSVAGGGLVVGANWHDGAVDDELAQKVVRDMERWLGQVAEQAGPLGSQLS